MIIQKKLFSWFVIICGFGGIDVSESINILGIVTSLSKSHSIFANSIFSEFANTGHSVMVLSPHSQSQKINHFPLEGLEKLKRGTLNNYKYLEESDPFAAVSKKYEAGLSLTEKVLQHPGFKKLLESRLNVDVIILDYDYNEALLGLSNYFNCPVIVLSTQNKLPLRGLTKSPVFLHNLFYKTKSPKDVLSKLGSVAVDLYEALLTNFYYYRQQSILYHEVFGSDIPQLTEALKNSILKIFISSLPARLDFMPTDIIDVTGVHIIDKSFFDYSFSDPLDQFIHSSEDGCIYVSLGADLDPETLPKDKVNQIYRALYQRPERIIWAWNGNTPTFAISNDFFMVHWLPQQDILRHRNIKAFVTTGGHLSLIESIYYQVPIIGIPLTYEQAENLDNIVANGLGVKLELENVTVESISWAVNEVLDNESYHARLSTSSYLMQSRPMTPFKTVKYWVEYVYSQRKLGVSHGESISTLDFYLSELCLVALLVLLMISFFITVICRFFYSFSEKIIKKKAKMF